MAFLEASPVSSLQSPSPWVTRGSRAKLHPQSQSQFLSNPLLPHGITKLICISRVFLSSVQSLSQSSQSVSPAPPASYCTSGLGCRPAPPLVKFLTRMLISALNSRFPFRTDDTDAILQFASFRIRQPRFTLPVFPLRFARFGPRLSRISRCSWRFKGPIFSIFSILTPKLRHFCSRDTYPLLNNLISEN